MREINKKYHYVYKIVNNLNGMEYIGVHSTDNLDDNYFGSGTYLKNAVRKHGRDKFTKEILKNCNCRKEALAIEKDIVKEDYISRLNVYNLVLGGGVPLLRCVSKSKFKKADYYPIEQYQSDVKELKREKFRIDIPYEERLKFIPNTKNIKIQKIYLELYRRQIEKKYGDDFSIYPNKLHFKISSFILDKMEDICCLMTEMYNDSRYHKKARGLLNQFNSKGFVGDCIEIAGLNVA